MWQAECQWLVVSKCLKFMASNNSRSKVLYLVSEGFNSQETEGVVTTILSHVVLQKSDDRP